MWISAAFWLAVGSVIAGQGRGGRQTGPAPSPASQRPPQTVTAQSYAPEEVRAGQERFASQCGFCHGRDAAGGETGPDLTRSILVAEDVRGDRIGPLVRAGRPDKGMPAFEMSDADLNALTAYIHDQKNRAELQGGGRRSVDVADLQTGSAAAGRKYFDGAGNCAKCHSPTGDLAGIASRFQGLSLLQRMLYPAGGRPAPSPPKVRVILPSGETVTGLLVSRDEFSIAVTDAAGVRRVWATNAVKFRVEDPMAAHFDQLGRYTDEDMHDVFAYLETLK